MNKNGQVINEHNPVDLQALTAAAQQAQATLLDADTLVQAFGQARLNEILAAGALKQLQARCAALDAELTALKNAPVAE